MKKEFSSDARDMLKRLLDTQPHKRLGSGPAGSQEIRDHPFFAEIDWDKLYNREIEAPFIPEIKNDEDTSQIDQMFTNEAPQETLIVSKLDVNEKEKNYYQGFTFEKNDLMAGNMNASGNFGGKK